MSTPLRRRQFVMAASAFPLGLQASEPEPGPARAIELLRRGGVVAAFRHTLAPGTFDPPEFRLGDCTTQRNLSDEGREQARRIGAWFRQHRLKPVAVRSSPWCRCVDTARLAFAPPQGDTVVEPWAALGSPAPERRSGNTAAYAARLETLRQALARASAAPQKFEVWVTHQFVLQDLAAQTLGSGAGLILRHEAGGGVRVEARLELLT